jgi:peptidoglycan/xylan/chitin deacetylase (PgdA/CDA1 family)
VVGSGVADPLRRAAAGVARGPIGAVGAAAVDRALPRRNGVLAILTYHRVDEPSARPDLMPSLISATPAAFREQIALVARQFEPVSLGDVLEAIDEPSRLPARAVLVTFDDGYLDFAANAWPVLREASVPATLFVATAFSAEPATPFWWDRLWAAVRGAPAGTTIATPDGELPAGPDAARGSVATLRTWLKGLDHEAAMAEVERIVGELGGAGPVAPPAVLDWDALRTLAAEGVTLAPHTRHHPLLDRVPVERAIEEIALSHADLQREVGAVAPIPRVLAYPSGAHGGSAVVAARQAGMDLAMTTERGGNDLRRADRLRLRRINVGGRASAPLVRAQLAWAGGLDARRRRSSTGGAR